MEEQEYNQMFAVERSHWWFVARRVFVEVFLKKAGITPGGRLRIVDIGAGTGGMETFLSKYGKVIGIEPNPLGRTLAKRRGIILKAGTAQHTRLGANSVDLVCFFDVLYHKRIDQSFALNEAHRILVSGGRLLITDCAFPWLYGRNDEAVHGARRYTKKTMTTMLKEHKFSIQHSSYTFFFLFPVFVVNRLLLSRFLKTKGSDVRSLWTTLNAIFKAICYLEALLLSYVVFPYGSSIMVLATKKSL